MLPRAPPEQDGRVKRMLVTLMVTVALLTVGAGPAHAAVSSAVSGARVLEMLPGTTGGYASAVNASGVVIGEEYGADGHRIPVRWVDGRATALELPDHYHGDVAGINSAGLIVGNIIPYRNPGGTQQAVSWGPDGRMTRLAPGRGDARVNAVNDRGDIVGTAYPDGQQAAVQFAGGTVVSLLSRPNATVGVCIANRPPTELLAGLLYTESQQPTTTAFVYGPDGAFTTLPGQGFLRMAGISADGTTIAGMADGGFPITSHPVLWQYDIDVDSQRMMWHLWDLGTVFGYVFQPGRISPNGHALAGVIDASTPTAAVWRDSTYYLLPTGQIANDINDAGLAVGMDNKRRPVTWTVG
jgi:uncharacterized membrane protein